MKRSRMPLARGIGPFVLFDLQWTRWISLRIAESCASASYFSGFRVRPADLAFEFSLTLPGRHLVSRYSAATAASFCVTVNLTPVAER